MLYVCTYAHIGELLQVENNKEQILSFVGKLIRLNGLETEASSWSQIAIFIKIMFSWLAMTFQLKTTCQLNINKFHI